MPRKRIIVCCDGTWKNSDGSGQVPTNVAKLARCIQPEAEVTQGGEKIQVKQVVYYQHGVGSVAGWLFGGIENAIEGATGGGVRENIMQAYQFICLNYQHGDEIFLFGFCRGAFTARSIAHFIWKMGLLTNKGLSLVPCSSNGRSKTSERSPKVHWGTIKKSRTISETCCTMSGRGRRFQLKSVQCGRRWDLWVFRDLFSFHNRWGENWLSSTPRSCPTSNMHIKPSPWTGVGDSSDLHFGRSQVDKNCLAC